jgi:hypothetical protein
LKSVWQWWGLEIEIEIELGEWEDEALLRPGKRCGERLMEVKKERKGRKEVDR